MNIGSHISPKDNMFTREKDNGLLRDISGEVFGQLTILSLAPIEEWKFNRPHWICECSCGNIIVRSGTSLRQGKRDRKSCGCKRWNWKHGMSNTPEYNSWKGMFKRCYNPNNRSYKWYGARGVTVDPVFRDFRRFYEEVGPKPGPGYSIDRIDNNGNYEPGNIRWATQSEQNYNQRHTT